MGLLIFFCTNTQMLNSELFESHVKMCVRPALPFGSIMVILGNDIAGDCVWPDQTACSVVVPGPIGSHGVNENEAFDARFATPRQGQATM